MTSPPMDLRDQASLYASLNDEVFDILVIGAGITGCGIARDAALRGLKVALVDARDIGAGTSSRSSKLIHGGLRYLAQGEVKLVREASRERMTLRRIAPHLALTNPMVLLARSHTALLKLKAAVWSYEKLGGVPARERHQVWDAEALLSREPLLRDEGRLAGAVVYPEFLTDDSRLTLANARAAAEAGAVVATYTAVHQIVLQGGRARGCIVCSTLPGETVSTAVNARIVVNAAGPWVDEIRRMEESSARDMLALTKGVHVTVSRDRLSINHTIVISTPDRRAIFAVPRGRHVYIGTTDTFYPNAQYWPSIDEQDVAYLLGLVNETFSVQPLGQRDVLTAWSGLRPLLRQGDKRPSEISRRDEVVVGPAGVITVAGGKLTNYRPMARRVVDLCERHLGREPSPCRTAQVPLPGGDISMPLEELRQRLMNLGLSKDEAFRAVFLYGSEAEELASGGWGPEMEAHHAVTKEGALTLEDLWFRRTSMAFFPPVKERQWLDRASRAMARLMGWTEDQREAQVQQCLRRARPSLFEQG